jgi:hypothetical protein
MAETVDMVLSGDPKLWLGARPCIMPVGVGETIFRTDCLHPSCLTCGFRHHISLIMLPTFFIVIIPKPIISSSIVAL